MLLFCSTLFKHTREAYILIKKGVRGACPPRRWGTPPLGGAARARDLNPLPSHITKMAPIYSLECFLLG